MNLHIIVVCLQEPLPHPHISLPGLEPHPLAYIIGGLVLLEGILHRSICHIGKHVLQEDRFLLKIYLIGGHVLHNGMSYITACLTYGMSIKRSCVTGEHVLWVYMFYMNEWFKYN